MKFFTRKTLKNYSFLCLGAICLTLILNLCDQNRILKSNSIEYKNYIDDLIEKTDSLENEIDTLIYNRELSRYDIDKDDILEAIMFIESGNNNNAYAAGEDAVGCLQIRKCMVDDVNRILNRKKSSIYFNYSDRWDRKKSIEMFNIFVTYYKLNTAEEIARGWNGGPKGINKSTTVQYWNKVEAELSS